MSEYDPKTITGSVISNNSARYGGAIASSVEYGNASITITGSVVSNNTAQSAGGGLYSRLAKLQFQGTDLKAGPLGLLHRG